MSVEGLGLGLALLVLVLVLALVAVDPVTGVDLILDAETDAEGPAGILSSDNRPIFA